MSVKTKAELRTYADANRNTNGTQSLTGATENVMWNDVIDSMATDSDTADTFVPYSYATSDVNLGDFNVEALELIAHTNDGGYSGNIKLEKYEVAEPTEKVTCTIKPSNVVLTTDYDVLLPKEAGTLALVSDIPKTETLMANIPVDGVVSNSLTWLGEQRVVAAGITADYTTDFSLNNQHCTIIIKSLTGSGVVTFTGVSNSESSGVPTAAITEEITVDAIGSYQTNKKWIEITNIDIPAGITNIDYDIGVLGYIDMQNMDFKLKAMRVDMTSGGINADVSILIEKVQDDGNGKMSIVAVEHIGVDAGPSEIIDEIRTGADDRSYSAGADIWGSGQNYSLKQNDYDTYFVADENVFEGSTKAEGFLVSLEGTNSGAINNVSMLNIMLTIEYQ